MRKVVFFASGGLSTLVLGILIYLWATQTYRITGTITRDGKPLVWKTDKHELRVWFVPLDRVRHQQFYKCTCDAETGKYIHEGIPAGKYRVAIQQIDPYPKNDLLNYVYSFKDSPLTYTVQGASVKDFDVH
jgi:hypothetical protein